MSEKFTQSDAPELESYVAENYEALVADKGRNLTFKKLAEQADANDDVALAAWARKRAHGEGRSVVPTEAVSQPQKVERKK